MDLLYSILTVVFFASAWGLLELCNRLMGGES
jgi:hypothetical protein